MIHGMPVRRWTCQWCPLERHCTPRLLLPLNPCCCHSTHAAATQPMLPLNPCMLTMGKSQLSLSRPLCCVCRLCGSPPRLQTALGIHMRSDTGDVLFDVAALYPLLMQRWARAAVRADWCGCAPPLAHAKAGPRCRACGAGCACVRAYAQSPTPLESYARMATRRGLLSECGGCPRIRAHSLIRVHSTGQCCF